MNVLEYLDKGASNAQNEDGAVTALLFAARPFLDHEGRTTRAHAKYVSSTFALHPIVPIKYISMIYIYIYIYNAVCQCVWQHTIVWIDQNNYDSNMFRKTRYVLCYISHWNEGTAG